MPRPFPPPWAPKRNLRRRADGNVAVLSHAEYVPALTAVAALRVKAALSKVAWWPWPLTFWPWKWCLSHVWRGLPLCQFWSSLIGLSVLDLGPMYATDVIQTSDVRQTDVSWHNKVDKHPMPVRIAYITTRKSSDSHVSYPSDQRFARVSWFILHTTQLFRSRTLHFQSPFPSPSYLHKS